MKVNKLTRRDRRGGGQFSKSQKAHLKDKATDLCHMPCPIMLCPGELGEDSEVACTVSRVTRLNMIHI